MAYLEEPRRSAADPWRPLALWARGFMFTRRTSTTVVSTLLLASCADRPLTSGTESAADTFVTEEPTSGGQTGDATSGSPGSTDDPLCKVADVAEAVVPCEDRSPADSFAPAVQWTWRAPPVAPLTGMLGSFSTPLVGNFTDDNADGEIDLCDTPDVLITAISEWQIIIDEQLSTRGYMYMLAGDTGAEELKFPVMVDAMVYPAFGDIDGDGLPEILSADPDGHLLAFEHDGEVAWTSPVVGGYRQFYSSAFCTAIGIYDLEGDGAPEILLGWEVYDNQGNLLFGDPTNAGEWDLSYQCVTPTAADLDGDGALEVVLGHEAYRADGSLYYKLDYFEPAHPQIANLDADPEPEILLTNANGITVLEHTGELKFGPLRPTDPNPGADCWGRPAVVHDFDGDGVADIAAATCTDFSVYTVGPKGWSPSGRTTTCSTRRAWPPPPRSTSSATAFPRPSSPTRPVSARSMARPAWST